MLLQVLTAGALVVGHDTLHFDRPATDLRTVYLYGTSLPTYFVTVDYTADFGWRTHTRTEPGLWDSDEDWPAPAKFP